MGKLKSINTVVAVLLIIMTYYGLCIQYDSFQAYGWKYKQITIIEGDIYENEISVKTQVYATFVVGLLGVLFLANNRAIVDYTVDITPFKLGESSGINFIGDTPDSYDIGYAPRERVIDVSMDLNRVEIPLMLILNWAGEHGLKWEWEIDLEDMK